MLRSQTAMAAADFFSPSQLKKALFLDRDGVVIDYIPYLSKPEQVRLPLGAGAALKQWQDAGYLLIVITNQSGVGYGYFSLADVAAVHQRLVEEYEQYGVKFAEIMVCPHHPQAACGCRKPSPRMLLSAAQKHRIALDQSYFLGDALSDLDCALNAGSHPLLVLTGLGQETREKLDRFPVKIPCFEQLGHTVVLLPESEATQDIYD